ncbi:hypothetical protein [Rhodococcus sp. NPDC057529]|uniref:hypothetical protein n=1 Tax=Rhodococcus sp. NPDC057529 TaxID=3346158 RepID=UPI00366EA9B3
MREQRFQVQPEPGHLTGPGQLGPFPELAQKFGPHAAGYAERVPHPIPLYPALRQRYAPAILRESANAVGV